MFSNAQPWTLLDVGSFPEREIVKIKQVKFYLLINVIKNGYKPRPSQIQKIGEFKITGYNS